MMRVKNGKFRFVAIALIFSFFFTFIPPKRPAYAVCVPTFHLCEAPGGVAASMAVVSGTVVAAINAAAAAVIAAWDAALAAMQAAFSAQSALVVLNIQSFFDTWWFMEMRPSLQDMTAQLSTSNTDQARAIASFYDAQLQTLVQLEQQTQELMSQRQARPSEQVCIVGTVSSGAMRANVVRKELTKKLAQESVVQSGNEVGSVTEDGAGADLSDRWQRHCTRYANPNSNRSVTGCPAAGTYPDADVRVTETLFSNTTLDITDPEIKQNLDDLKRNLLEPTVEDPILGGALDSATGRQLMLKKREVRAQRNVAQEAFDHVMARRSPGSQAADYINDIRDQAGIAAADLSANPSYAEVMEVLTAERFKTNEYYSGLSDEPENLQRELSSLSGLGLIQLSDTLDLIDRIGMLMSVQVANEINDNKISDSDALRPIN